MQKLLHGNKEAVKVQAYTSGTARIRNSNLGLGLRVLGLQAIIS